MVGGDYAEGEAVSGDLGKKMGKPGKVTRMVVGNGTSAGSLEGLH